MEERKKNVQVLLTLAIGAGGSLAADFLDLPAPALIGATIAVSVASLLRVVTRMPDWLRNCGFAVIGCSLGSGITGEIWQQVARWPLSLCMLAAAMGLMLGCSSWMLVRLFGQSKETALLAASPGALSYSLAIGATGVGDLRAIVVIQSLRLFGITAILPLVLDLFELSGESRVQAVVAIPWFWTWVLFLATLLMGRGLGYLRLPAAYLIGGVLVSGLLHLGGVVEGRPQPGFLYCGFVVTGSVVGARLATIKILELRRLAMAALAVFLLSTVLAAVCAWPASLLLQVPFGQVWVAYGPGGVEAMAAMAMALHYDTTFVALHHLVRIFLLLAGLPLLLKFSGISRPTTDNPLSRR